MSRFQLPTVVWAPKRGLKPNGTKTHAKEFLGWRFKYRRANGPKIPKLHGDRILVLRTGTAYLPLHLSSIDGIATLFALSPPRLSRDEAVNKFSY